MIRGSSVEAVAVAAPAPAPRAARRARCQPRRRAGGASLTLPPVAKPPPAPEPPPPPPPPRAPSPLSAQIEQWRSVIHQATSPEAKALALLSKVAIGLALPSTPAELEELLRHRCLPEVAELRALPLAAVHLLVRDANTPTHLVPATPVAAARVAARRARPLAGPPRLPAAATAAVAPPIVLGRGIVGGAAQRGRTAAVDAAADDAAYDVATDGQFARGEALVVLPLLGQETIDGGRTSDGDDGDGGGAGELLGVLVGVGAAGMPPPDEAAMHALAAIGGMAAAALEPSTARAAAAAVSRC